MHTSRQIIDALKAWLLAGPFGMDKVIAFSDDDATAAIKALRLTIGKNAIVIPTGGSIAHELEGFGPMYSEVRKTFAIILTDYVPDRDPVAKAMALQDLADEIQFAAAYEAMGLEDCVCLPAGDEPAEIAGDSGQAMAGHRLQFDFVQGAVRATSANAFPMEEEEP